MSRFIKPAAALLAAFPAVAQAVDLDALSGQPQRDACAAYVLIDLNVRRESGALTEAAYNSQSNEMIWKVWGKNRANAAAMQRRVNAMIDTIAGEQPSLGELAAQAGTCRRLLGL